jgi:hypothetical protein
MISKVTNLEESKKRRKYSLISKTLMICLYQEKKRKRKIKQIVKNSMVNSLNQLELCLAVHKAPVSNVIVKREF